MIYGGLDILGGIILEDYTLGWGGILEGGDILGWGDIHGEGWHTSGL